jgi:acyl-CoA thioesterase I
MKGANKSRREFISKSAYWALVAAAMPAFFSEFLLSCTVAKTAAGNTEDDLQNLQKAIADKQKPLKWIFTGDSITQGASHTLGYRSYPEIFSERIRFEMGRGRDIIINTAISGHTTKEIINDFDWRVAQFAPNVVLLMIGTNDVALSRHISAEEFADNLKTLVQKFRNLSAIPVLQTPNIINTGNNHDNNERSRLPFYVDKIRNVAAQYNTILVDHWKHWEENKERVLSESWLNDPLHPNGKGHLEMARMLFKRLNICDGYSFTCEGQVNF